MSRLALTDHPILESMAAKRVRRQVLLFLLGVLIPGMVLLGFGLMLIRQEAELSQRRDSDALSIRARALADSLETWLEAGLTETNDSLRAGVYRLYPAHDQLLMVGAYTDGVYHDASSRLPTPHPLVETRHAVFVQDVERQEFARGDAEGAIQSLRARLSSESDSIRTSDLRIRLARALYATDEPDLAGSEARLVFQKGSEIVDEFGTPLALYAADLLIARDLLEGMCERLSFLAGTSSWLTLGAAGYLSDLTQRAGCSENILLDDLLDRTRIAGRVATLGERLINDRASERWIVLDDSWLVRRVDGDHREMEAVVAVRIADIAKWLVASGVDSVRVIHPSQSLGERERLLAPEFTSLRVVFPPVRTRVFSRRTLFGLAVLLVVLMTVMGGYLLWRDRRRERRLLNLQSQFVASVSHELRTPLTSIRLFSEAMLEYDSVDHKEREKGLRVIAHESGRLSRMLNNVLNTTRVERGTMTYECLPGDLADPAENAIEAMLHEFDQAHMTIERDLAMARSTFDSDAMEQAVLNLLSNALKYASSGGCVVVKSWEENGHAAVSVEDFGPGIPVAEQERVFERFYRLNGNNDQRLPGAGLGLALIRHIVEGNGGTIVLSSEPGSGCQFTIQLPICA